MENIYQDMAKPFLPMIYTNWAIGVGILEFPLGKPRRLLSFMYSTIILTIYWFSLVIAFDHHINNAASRKRPTAETLFYALNAITTTSIIISGWFQTKRVRRCMMKAAFANHLMQKLGIPKTTSTMMRKQLSKILASLFFITIIFVVSLSITMDRDDTLDIKLLLLFVRNYPIIIISIADLSFLNFIAYAHLKFGELNGMLRNLLTSTDEMPLHRRIANQIFLEKIFQPTDELGNEIKDYSFLIRHAKLAHLQLIKLCREANIAYGSHIFISVAAAFFQILNKIFNITLAIEYKNEFKAGRFLATFIRNINWLFYFCIKTVIFSICCQMISNISMESGDIICELYDEPQISKSTQDEIRYFNVELIENKLQITGFGVFTVDLQLIQQIIGGIITYSILMIQLEFLNNM